MTEVVDLAGIAELLEVQPHTPNQWRQRKLLPKVDFPDIKTPLWRKSTIINWARLTGRLPESLRSEISGRREDSYDPGRDLRLETPKPVSPARQNFQTAEDRGARIPPVIFKPATIE